MSVTLMFQRGQARPCRPIPAAYEGDEDAIWALKQSGWLTGEFHMDPEEEAEFERLVDKAYEPLSHSPPSREAEAQPTPHVAPTPALPTHPSPQGTPDYESYSAEVEDSHTEVEFDWKAVVEAIINGPAPSLENNDYALHVMERGTSKSVSPAPSKTPRRPVRLHSPTPELSPSNSVTSEAETEVDLDALLSASGFVLPPPAVIVTEPTLVESEESFFAGLSHIGQPIPQLFAGLAVMPPTPVQTPELKCETDAHFQADGPWLTSPCHGRGYSQSLPRLPSPPVAGPSRPNAKRAEVRRARAGPYSRHEHKIKRKDEAINVEDVPTEVIKSMQCPECGYHQVGGSGSTRSFKRHLTTHDCYKAFHWICRGVPQPDGTYAGGCGKEFARKDALQRHVRSRKETDCVSDFLPVVV